MRRISYISPVCSKTPPGSTPLPIQLPHHIQYPIQQTPHPTNTLLPPTLLTQSNSLPRCNPPVSVPHSWPPHCPAQGTTGAPFVSGHCGRVQLTGYDHFQPVGCLAAVDVQISLLTSEAFCSSSIETQEEGTCALLKSIIGI